MAKPVQKSVTLNNLATDVGGLTKMVENGFADVYQKMDKGFADVYQKMDKGFADVYQKMDKGFADVRAELSKVNAELLKKANKSDVEAVKDDVNRLAKATKIGFDGVHQELELKVNREEMGEIGEGIEGIRQRFGGLDNRLDTFASHEKRLINVEKLVGVPV